MNRELLLRKIKEAGVTQTHIAKELGLTKQGIHLKIKGKTRFLASEAIKIMEILHLSFEEFVEIFEEK